MFIQINTDSNIEGNNEMAQQFENIIANGLERFSEQITRVEVHLSDENSDKKFGTEDKRCLIEARLAGLQPIAVSHQAATVDQAVDGAIDQMVSLIETTLGKLDSQ